MNLYSWSNKGTIHIQIMGKGFLRGGEEQSMYNQCKEDWLVGWAKGKLASMQWGQRIGGIILQTKAEYQYDFIVNVRKSHWKIINKRVILQAIFLK